MPRFPGDGLGLLIKMAGQDITNFVQELPDTTYGAPGQGLYLESALGQGSGVGSEHSGTATQFQFETSLGPAATAVGAGSVISTPTLVRFGEVQVWDTTGLLVFGGYATKISDLTVKTKVFTQVSCNDYWQFTDHLTINELYDGVTDIFIIKDLCTKYASWIDLSLLPTTPAYTFTLEYMRGKTLQWGLQRISDKTGLMIWIGPDKKLHYVNPSQASTAPFSLSDSPDFIKSFGHSVSTFDVDDNAAVNRVTFFGGKTPSQDFTQDLSTQANGNNKLFVLAYYPRKASDGSVHVWVNAVEQSVGFVLGNATDPRNVFISQGGSANVLLNADAHTLSFDVAPASGASVTSKYRFETPLIVQMTDQASLSFYGRFLDAVISDDTVFDRATAVQRCKILLLEQSRGLTTLQAVCWRGGLQAGQLLKVVNAVRGINNTYIVQKVTAKPLGRGNFEYTVDLGAWNWSLVDIVLQLTRNAQTSDTSAQEQTSPVTIAPKNANLAIHGAATPTTHAKSTYVYGTAKFGLSSF